DALADDWELKDARTEAESRRPSYPPRVPDPLRSAAVGVCCRDLTLHWVLENVIRKKAWASLSDDLVMIDWEDPARQGAFEIAAREEFPAQAVLIRDSFGNPFRPVALDPAWRTSTVAALATAAYEERILPAGTLDPDRLAVLADALEDAACDNSDILSH